MKHVQDFRAHRNAQSFLFYKSSRAMQFGVMNHQSCSSVHDEPRKIVDDFSTFKSFFS